MVRKAVGGAARQQAAMARKARARSRSIRNTEGAADIQKAVVGGKVVPVRLSGGGSHSGRFAKAQQLAGRAGGNQSHPQVKTAFTRGVSRGQALRSALASRKSAANRVFKVTGERRERPMADTSVRRRRQIFENTRGKGINRSHKRSGARRVYRRDARGRFA